MKYLAFNHHSRIYSTFYYVALNHIETYFVEFCRHNLRHIHPAPPVGLVNITELAPGAVPVASAPWVPHCHLPASGELVLGKASARRNPEAGRVPPGKNGCGNMFIPRSRRPCSRRSGRTCTCRPARRPGNGTAGTGKRR